MNADNIAQPSKTNDNTVERQVDDKTAKRVRRRSGEGTLAYWRTKLFRNCYRDRDGNIVEIPEYYVRLRHAGVTKRVRLHTSDREKAAEEALGLSARLLREGWAAVEAGKARLPASPTLDQFCDAYLKAAQSMENPPRPVSLALYVRHLRQVCALAGIKTLRELTSDAIERARDKYRAMAKADGRSPAAAQNSLGMIFRNAAACFSTEARAILARQGLDTQNPFASIRRSQKIDPVTPLPVDVVDRIWSDLPLLRDGNPEAPDPKAALFAKKYRKQHEGRKARWLPVDFRKPHADAYCAILLALGAGLRANEIDKARWDWLKTDQHGNDLLEIREEADFKPKGGTLRLLRIPKAMRDSFWAANSPALVATSDPNCFRSR